MLGPLHCRSELLHSIRECIACKMASAYNVSAHLSVCMSEQAAAKALKEREAALLTLQAIEADMDKRRHSVAILEEEHQRVHIILPAHTVLSVWCCAVLCCAVLCCAVLCCAAILRCGCPQTQHACQGYFEDCCMHSPAMGVKACKLPHQGATRTTRSHSATLVT